MKIYLQVNHGDASKVEDLGAKWDDGFNRWYINAWTLPEAFLPFAPKNYDEMMDARFARHQLTPYEEEFLQNHPYEEDIYDEDILQYIRSQD